MKRRKKQKWGMRAQRVQFLLKVANSPKTLYDYQARFFDDESRFRICLKSVQIGMTTACALEAAHDVISFPNYDVMFVSRSLPQSLELMRHAKREILTPLKSADYVRWKDEPYRYKLEVEDYVKTKVTFPNGSRIMSLSSNPDTIRSFKANAVYVDEAAMFKNSYEVKSATLGRIARGGKITILSTPKGRHGWFADEWYEAWDMEHAPAKAIWKGKSKKGHEPRGPGEKIPEEDEGWRAHCFHYTECPDLTPAKIKALRKEMGPLTAKQELDLVFLEDAETMMSMTQILACVPAGSLEYEFVPYHILKPQYQIVLAVDFGRTRDSTVLMIIENINGQRYLRWLQALDGGDIEMEVIPAIKTLISLWSPDPVIIDKTGMGIPIFDRLVKLYGRDRIIGYSINSEAKKKALVTVGHQAVLNQTIHFPNISETEPLINQLHMFQRFVNPRTGHVKYQHPRGEHDDYVITLFLGCMATSQDDTGEYDLIGVQPFPKSPIVRRKPRPKIKRKPVGKPFSILDVFPELKKKKRSLFS